MLAGGLVGQFGEAADQLLEHMAHLCVVHPLRVQVDVGELLGHQVQQAGFGQPFDLGLEVEALEDVPRLRREALDVAVEVLRDMILIPQEGRQVQLGGVVEAGAADDALEEWIGVHASCFSLRQFSQHLRLCGRQHAVKAPQHGEREDHPPVLGLLVVAA